MATKKFIIIGIIGVIVIYLLFAFANVSFNLKEWSEFSTGLCALFMGTVSFLVLFACIINDSNKK